MEKVSGTVRRIPVTIYDRDYLVRTDESVQHINKLANVLDVKMREISGGNPNILEVKIAVLAALTILDEKIKIQEKYEELLAFMAEYEEMENEGRDLQESEDLEDVEKYGSQRVISEYE